MNHPVITFRPQVNPLIPPKPTRGILIGEYLVVSYATPDLDHPTYSLYNTAGRKLFDAAYADCDSAVRMAEWLNQIFSEFFPIWQEWADADVFGLARWSVRNGTDIYDILKKDHALR